MEVVGAKHCCPSVIILTLSSSSASSSSGVFLFCFFVLFGWLVG